MIPARGAAIVHVKICGVTNWADARLAVDLGRMRWDLIFIRPARARSAPRRPGRLSGKLPPFVATVGVFVNWPAEVVAALARALRLDGVQLHGDEPPGEAAELASGFA